MCTIPFGFSKVPDVYIINSLSSLSIGSGSHFRGAFNIAYDIITIIMYAPMHGYCTVIGIEM